MEAVQSLHDKLRCTTRTPLVVKPELWTTKHLELFGMPIRRMSSAQTLASYTPVNESSTEDNSNQYSPFFREYILIRDILRSLDGMSSQDQVLTLQTKRSHPKGRNISLPLRIGTYKCFLDYEGLLESELDHRVVLSLSSNRFEKSLRTRRSPDDYHPSEVATPYTFALLLAAAQKNSMLDAGSTKIQTCAIYIHEDLSIHFIICDFSRKYLKHVSDITGTIAQEDYPSVSITTFSHWTKTASEAVYSALSTILGNGSQNTQITNDSRTKAVTASSQPSARRKDQKKKESVNSLMIIKDKSFLHKPSRQTYRRSERIANLQSHTSID